MHDVRIFPFSEPVYRYNDVNYLSPPCILFPHYFSYPFTLNESSNHHPNYRNINESVSHRRYRKIIINFATIPPQKKR